MKSTANKKEGTDGKLEKKIKRIEITAGSRALSV